jgi:hypothetical protein
MATPTEEAPARAGGGGFSFTRKIGPLPVWAWMAVILGLAVAYSSYRKNRQAASGTNATGATTAGTQTAAQTPPFVIQNFPNQPNMPAAGNGANPQVGAGKPQVISVGHNQPVQNVINWARANGYPNYSWSDFWALNPTLPGLKSVNNQWILSGYGTPVTLSKPGFTSTGNAGPSADYTGANNFPNPAPNP